MRETEGHSSALGGRAVKATHTEQEGKLKMRIVTETTSRILVFTL